MVKIKSLSLGTLLVCSATLGVGCDSDSTTSTPSEPALTSRDGVFFDSEGRELMNEPVIVANPARLDDFNDSIGLAIREAAPARLYPDGVSASCDGQPAETTAVSPGRTEVRCGGSALNVGPRS